MKGNSWELVPLKIIGDEYLFEFNLYTETKLGVVNTFADGSQKISGESIPYSSPLKITGIASMNKITGIHIKYDPYMTLGFKKPVIPYIKTYGSKAVEYIMNPENMDMNWEKIYSIYEEEFIHTGNTDIEKKFIELKNLLDKKLIDENEYDQLRKKLLDNL